MRDCWDQYKLLLWKSMLVEYYNKIQFILQLIIPFIICLPLLSLKAALPPIREKGVQYNAVELNNLQLLRLSFDLEMTLLYSPKNKILENLVKEAAKNLKLDGYKGFEDPQELENAFQHNNYLCGIQFPDNWNNLQKLPKRFTFKIRFPSELRTINEGLWDTHKLFKSWRGSACRNKYDNTGGQPDYYDEGFVQVQNAISMAYIKAVKTDNESIPDILLKRYPCPSLLYDGVLQEFQAIILILLPLYFVYPGTILTRRIAVEREHHLKDLMKVIGVDGYVHWLTYFTMGIIQFSIPSFALIFTLKVPIKGSAILSNANWILLFLYMLIYITCCTSFTFLIGVSFNHETKAAVAYAIIHMLSPITFGILLLDPERTSYATKLFSIIPFNSAFVAGIYIALSQELFNGGLIWDNISNETIQLEHLTMAHAMLTLLITGIIYILLCLYIEQIHPGKYSIPRPWNFPFTRQFWIGDTRYRRSRRSGSSSATYEQTNAFEKGPINKATIIQVTNLRTEFKKNIRTLDNISFNVYENETTVLMGSLNSGKTTLLYIISGIFHPTNGTVTINGYDIEKNLNEARESFAICPEENALFNELSVSQHLEFFCQLKGLTDGALKMEVEKYLKLFRMQYFRNYKVKHLSHGMKRKVAISCTLCGSTKLVLIDLPSVRTDAISRNEIWKILEREKKNRTILITTTSMEEAYALGDRIGIIAYGKIKCYATPLYLKKTFGNNYKLTCNLGNDSDRDVRKITEVIQKYIPNIQPESHIRTELCYTLSGQHIKTFPKMFQELEKNQDKLKIISFRIELVSLEDIFIKMDGQNKYAQPTKVSPNFITINKQTVTGGRLRCYRWSAMLYKRILYLYYKPYILICMILLACLPKIIHILTEKDDDILQPLTPMTYSLRQYPKGITVMQMENDIPRYSYLDYVSTNYTMYVMLLGRHYKNIPIGNQSFSQYIISIIEESQVRMNNEYLAAVTINSTNIIVWLNAQPLHTAPLTLNLVHNALVMAATAGDYEIVVTNHPLPYSTGTIQKLYKRMSRRQPFLGLFIIWPSYFFALFPNYERNKRFQLLQMIAGVSAHIFWMANLLFDMLIYLLIFFLLTVILVAFSEYDIINYFGYVFLIIILYELATLALIYCASYLFKSGLYAFLITSVLDWLVLLYIRVQGIDNQMKYIFFPSPTLHLVIALYNIDLYTLNTEFCQNPNIAAYADLFKCTFYPNCCNDKGLLKWIRPSILPEVAFLCGLFIIYFFAVYMFEYKTYRQCLISTKEASNILPDEYNDNDVKQMDKKIRALTKEQLNEYRLALDHVKKKYSSYVAIDNVSLALKPKECLALIGVNGAGKSTIFKMISGDTYITFGHGYVNGYDINKKWTKYYGKINYCPEINALLGEFTCKQTIRIFCLIRGIRYSNIKLVIQDLATVLHFTNYLNRCIKDCNDTIKRKISIAIAVIGLADLILLDEPTTYMDPQSKQQSLLLFTLLKNSGSSILISSTNAEEYAVFCNQIAVLNQGKLMCLGTIPYLKEKYSKGLNITIYMTAETNNGKTLSERIGELTVAFFAQYPNAILQSINEDQLKLFLPLNDVKLSEVFNFMQNSRQSLYIADYYIYQATLDNVFLAMSHDTRRFSRLH